MNRIPQPMLQDQLRERDLSLRAAAKEIGVAHTTLARILEGYPADLETLEKICIWLELPLSSLLDIQIEKDDLLDKLNALLAIEPALKEVIVQGLEMMEKGIVPPQVLREVVNYAAYKLNLRMEDIDKSEPSKTSMPERVHVRQSG